MRSSDPVSHFGELTVASFRTWRSWAPYSCTGLDLSGADRGRTDDLLVANEALSQLSYSPERSKTHQDKNRKRARNDQSHVKVTNRGEKSNFAPNSSPSYGRSGNLLRSFMPFRILCDTCSRCVMDSTNDYGSFSTGSNPVGSTNFATFFPLTPPKCCLFVVTSLPCPDVILSARRVHHGIPLQARRSLLSLSTSILSGIRSVHF